MITFLFKPMSLGEGMLVMFLVLLVLGVIGVAVVYYGLKFFADHINSRRDLWTETAQTLGLEFQEKGLIKPLKGVYLNHQVEVWHLAPDGENKYTICKIILSDALPYDLKIDTQNNLLRVMEAVFGSDEIEIGVDAFDKAFSIKGYDETAIRNFLSVHLPDGKSPNLIALLLSLRKSGHFIIMSGDTVQLQKRGEFLDVDRVKSLLDSTIYLAEQIQEAQKRVVKA